jgi:MFS family permease
MGLGFGTLSLISVFMRPLEAELGWSRAEISLAYALATVGMAFGGVVWGWVSDRVDMPILLAIGGSGMVLPLLAMAAVNAPWQAYLAQLALGGLGFAVLYAPLLSATGEWFEHRRGLAVGIVTAGGAAGQGALPFLANWLIDAVGWRLSLVLIAAATALALAATLRWVVRPSGAAVATRAGLRPTGCSRNGERLQLAALALAAFLCCACMGVPLVHLASYVGSVCGSPAVGATSLLVAMLFGAGGRICVGTIADRIGPLKGYALASATQTACVAAYPLLGDRVSLLALSAVFGVGFAGNMTCLVLCVRELVSTDRFGAALGTVMLVAWAGMGVGAYAGGALFDLAASYTLSFALAAAAGLLNLATISALAILRRASPGRGLIPRALPGPPAAPRTYPAFAVIEQDAIGSLSTRGEPTWTRKRWTGWPSGSW